MEVLTKAFSTHFFVSLDAGDNISQQLNRESIADCSLWRALLAICQRSREPIFLEVIDSLVLLA